MLTRRRRRETILVNVNHDESTADQCDRIIRVNDGKIERDEQIRAKGSA